MNRFLALAVLSSAFVACSRASVPSQPIGLNEQRAPIARATPPVYATLMQEHCAMCHDGATHPLDLSGNVKLEADVALRAALMVAAKRMPPPSVPEMPQEEQAALIGSLCDGAAPDPLLCRASYLRIPTQPLARHPSEAARAIEASGAPFSEEQEHGALRFIFGGQIQDSSRVVRLDPTFEASVLMVAGEQCKALADSQAKLDACFAKYLSRDNLLPPQSQNRKNQEVRR